MKIVLYRFTSILIVLLAVACKKEGDVKISSKNATLIVGRWLTTQRHILVNKLDDNVLLKDTIIYYDVNNNTNWWFETYNADGYAFVTGKPYRLNDNLKAEFRSVRKVVGWIKSLGINFS